MENSPHAHPPAPLRVFRWSSAGAVKCSWGKSSLQTLERFPGQRRAAALPSPSVSQQQLFCCFSWWLQLWFLARLIPRTVLPLSEQTAQSHLCWLLTQLAQVGTRRRAGPRGPEWVPPCFWSTPPWLWWSSASHLWAPGKKLLCPLDSWFWPNSACEHKQEWWMSTFLLVGRTGQVIRRKLNALIAKQAVRVFLT